MFKNAILALLLFILAFNLIGCGVIGPVVTSTICSNPAWIPKSDKIAYFELVEYGVAAVETVDIYKTKLVLNIKSLSNPFFHKKISWTLSDPDLINRIRISFFHLSFSPKGDKIVFSISQGGITNKRGEIFIVDINKKDKFQKIIDSGFNPEWAPVGEEIVYQGIGQNGYFTTDDNKLMIGSVDFGKRENKLIKSEIKNQVALIMLLTGENPKYSSDGNKIIFSAADWIFVTDKYGKSVRQIKIPYDGVTEPALSPDMTKVVFCKYRKGYHRTENNIYIANAITGAIEKEIIKPNGKSINKDINVSIHDPVWSPNGKYIAYVYVDVSTAIFVIKKDGSGLRLIADRRSRFGR